MSDILLKIFGVAILGALLSVFLRKWNSDMAQLLRVAVGVALALFCIALLSPLIERVRDLASSALGEAASKAVSVLVRVLCVALLSHVCASICRDCGETTVAYYAELGGKIEIMLLCLPLFLDVLDIAGELLEMSQ